MLNGRSLKQRGIIKNYSEDGFRDAGYELRIGEIITPGGNAVEEYLLPPQGVVKVISKESVFIPVDITAFVYVKTKLCNEGVLALNIGIVDPLFKGPLQSALINFGKSEVRLRAKDVYSRIVFHELDIPAEDVFSPEVGYLTAKRNAVDQMDRSLGGSFLNIKDTVDKAAKNMMDEAKKKFLIYVPLAAIFITILTFSLNFMNVWAVNHQFKPKSEALELQKDLNYQLLERVKVLESSNKELIDKIKILDKDKL